MTPEWLLQALWFASGIGATGAFWYFLSQRQPHAALWVAFATAVVFLLAVTLQIRNDLLRRDTLVQVDGNKDEPFIEISDASFREDDSIKGAHHARIVMKNGRSHAARKLQWVLVAAEATLDKDPVWPVEKKGPIAELLQRDVVFSLVTQPFVIVGNAKPLLIYLALSYEDAENGRPLSREAFFRWEGVNPATGRFPSSWSIATQEEASRLSQYARARGFALGS